MRILPLMVCGDAWSAEYVHERDKRRIHEVIDKIAALIKRISAKYTILMVEHNLSVVANLSDIITVLTRGQVLAQGNYAELSRDERVKEAYLGAGHA